MVEFEITRVSSKGQVVIPKGLRKGFNAGVRLLMIKDGEQLLLKKANAFDEKLKEDLDFARETEEAWKRYDKGLFKRMSAEEFLKELEKW